MNNRESLAIKPPGVCTLCYYPTWTTQEIPDSPYEVSLDSYPTAAASAHAGCSGCKVLVQAWKYAFPEAETRGKTRFNFNVTSEHLWIHIFGGDSVRNIEVFTLAGNPTFKHIKAASNLPPSTHLEHSLLLIQSWIHNCRKHHPQCDKSAISHPPRLLDIMIEDPAVVKLVEVSPEVQVSRYACLSHCWGKTRSRHLTRESNLASNLTGIRVSELPQTFQDAILVARALEIPYLWIDSLCIIQDSRQDWIRHVVSMAAIYEEAYITLAAGASVDDDGGFFASPPELNQKPYKITIEADDDDDDPTSTLYARHAVDHPNAGWPARETLPLMKRGWCFQERLLARRYLLFGSKEVLWECREDVACSCSMTTDGGPFKPRGGTASDKPCFPNCPATKWQIAHLEDGARGTSGHREGVWRDVVEEYTCRELTFAGDKLPALEGIAVSLQRNLGLGEYLSGLWADSLRKDISWNHYGDDAPAGRPRKGPSWSWIYAADGRIEWPVGKLTLHNYTVRPVPVPVLIALPELVSLPPPCDELEISGRIYPVSLQTTAERDEYEQVFPLHRRCNVLEWKRRHSEPQLLSLRGSGGRLVQTLPGTDSHQQQPHSSQRTSATTEDPPEKDLYGSFNADYRFWSTEAELQYELQHAVFFLLGTEDYGARPGRGEFCWANGIVMRCVDREEEGLEMGGIGSRRRYERIGWLRYCTRRMLEEWEPPGFQSRFVLV
ncbi:HET-domain-containing protein [Periconia macrospinosa]|uniref:HET-domain-containing protein n=1 Tax=Periconia macrospinosa TaxID=97972 RepID=A0A2V1EDR1_9PLEO|nr:HET-domain-containing protein [Periconia macrospinosa]